MPTFNAQHVHTQDHGNWAYHTVQADVPERFSPRLNDEHLEHGWFTPPEVDELPLHPGFRDSWTEMQAPQREAAWHPLRTCPECDGVGCPHCMQAPPTVPSESWGYGTVSSDRWGAMPPSAEMRAAPLPLAPRPGFSFPSLTTGDFESFGTPPPESDDGPIFSSSAAAALHTGEIPGDEQFRGNLEVEGINPYSGINPSYLGHANGTPVYIKPESGNHQDDIAKERAAFAVAHAMGVPVPHTVAREVHIPTDLPFAPSPEEYQEDSPSGTLHQIHRSGPQLAQVQASVGGHNLYDSHEPEDVLNEYPERARQIALMDNVIGNIDRHMGNMVIGDDGELYPIDHGATFPEGQYYPTGMAEALQGHPLTEDEMALLQRIHKMPLNHLGFDAESGMQHRISQMLGSGIFTPTPRQSYE